MGRRLPNVSRWLVDGMNVVGSRPDGWWRDRDGAMRRLVAELDAFAAATGDPVAVVFDGRPRTIESSRVDVRFAARRGADAADDDIAVVAADDADPASLRVVSSGAALAGPGTAAGATVAGAGPSRRTLDEAQEDGGGGRGSDACPRRPGSTSCAAPTGRSTAGGRWTSTAAWRATPPGPRAPTRAAAGRSRWPS